jgi:hypothetical protein
MTRHQFAESFASKLLAREGLAAVWNLHEAAARAHQLGYIDEAETLIVTADAAERQWTGRGT